MSKAANEAIICQTGTSVARILLGIEKAAENGIIDETIDIALSGS